MPPVDPIIGASQAAAESRDRGGVIQSKAGSGRGGSAELNAVLDPRFLALLLILTVNDWWAKGTFSNLVTGKISDFAGPIVATVLVSVAATGLRVWLPVRAAAAIVAVWFSAINLSTGAARVTELFLDRVTPWSNTIVTDPTDLVGLIVLPAAVVIAQRPVVWMNRRRGRSLGFGIGCLACMASSAPYYPSAVFAESPDGLMVAPSTPEDYRERDADDSLVMGLLLDRATESWIEVDPTTDLTPLRPACETPELRCVRVAGNRIQEKGPDGTWKTVWDAALDDIAQRTSGEFTNWSTPAGFTGWGTPMVDSTGVVVIGMRPGGRDEPLAGPVADGEILIGWADGTWSPAERDFRPLPRTLFALSLFGALFFMAAWLSTKPNIDRSQARWGMVPATSGVVLCWVGMAAPVGMAWIALVPMIAGAGLATALPLALSIAGAHRYVRRAVFSGIAVIVLLVFFESFGPHIHGKAIDLAGLVLLVLAVATAGSLIVGLAATARKNGGGVILVGGALAAGLLPWLPMVLWRWTGLPIFHLATAMAVLFALAPSLWILRTAPVLSTRVVGAGHGSE